MSTPKTKMNAQMHISRNDNWNVVPRTADLMRIANLRRRMWSPEAAARLAAEMTQSLRTPYGQMQLRPVQALSLYELSTEGGLFGNQSVGSGKCLAAETEIFDASEGRRRMAGEAGFLTTHTYGSSGSAIAHANIVSCGIKECIRLELADGSTLVLSEDHPVYTARGWVPVGQVGMSDLVATARSVPACRELQISDDEVLFAAYLLSDGSVSQGATGFTNATPAVLTEFVHVAQRLADHTKNLGKGWKKNGVTKIDHPTAAYELKVSGVSWFRRQWGINGLAKEKRLPASFWSLSERQIGLFLNRFWACDGWVDRSSGPQIILASEKMIDDLKFLLLRLGIHSRKRPKPAKCKGKVFPAWRLTVSKHSTQRFFDCVGLVLGKETRCQEFLANLHATKRNTNVDVVPVDRRTMLQIFDEMEIPSIGGDWRKRNGRRQRTDMIKFVGATEGQFISREKFRLFCEKFNYRGAWSWLATSDICWERVRTIQTVGTKEVFDVNVPETGNLFASGILVHNTLFSLLAPSVLQRTRNVAHRPLLIVPASLIEKTERDAKMLADHWQLARFYKIVSYELLGRVQAASVLDDYGADFVFLDECHKTRNRRKSAVARRIQRWMTDHPNVICAAVSGTVTTRSLHDYAHIIRWCHRPQLVPMPLHWSELEAWARALDERPSEPGDPGALEILCNAEEQQLWVRDRRTAARRAYQRRLVDTPGVVATAESSVNATLIIRGVKPKTTPVLDEAFKILRGANGWPQTPDGWPIADGITMARHAREIAAGLFYRWEPRPPQDWLEARRVWCKFVRDTLKRSHTMDSELQVRNWAGTLDECEELINWLKVKDTFEPNTVPVWLCTSVLEFAFEWAQKHRGIIWSEHTAFGERLEREGGIPYYARKGKDARGVLIDDHPAEQSLVASIDSNKEGRNLQKWSENLVLGWPSSGAICEQMLGRTHRQGQEADEVTVDVVISCVEHLGAFEQSQRDAAYIEASTGNVQKLNLATIDMPPTLFGAGPRWEK